MLPTTALPCCLRQFQHVWLGQGLQYLPFLAQELGGQRMFHRCYKREDELQKTLFKAAAEQSTALG